MTQTTPRPPAYTADHPPVPDTGLADGDDPVAVGGPQRQAGGGAREAATACASATVWS